MVSKKKNMDVNGGSNQEKENNGGGVAEYEQSRAQRIKENLQRMNKLGILDLSRNLKPPPKPKPIRPQKPLPPSSGSPRRSSRIKTMPSVSYSEKRIPTEKVVKDVKIEIKEGVNLEVYTEEHEKMLGDHKETWKLLVDGYDCEGNRIYDPYAGKSCHQCRQKTIGLRTKCSKCKIVQGQFCGDCLFMRYGENIVEANENPDWVCPVCRDICNCSRCRRIKGWEPTGNVFRKAIRLRYKSVAHYLIHTRGPNGKQEDIAYKLSDSSEEDSLSPPHKDKQDNIVSQLNNKNDDKMEDDSKHVLTKKNIIHHDVDDNDDVDSDYNSDHIDDDDEDYSDD